MDPYPAEETGDIVLLAQMGISTNASGVGGGYDANRMRGYLEIDESSLDQAVETKIEEIRNLFGRDTDGDLIADTGIAVVSDQYVKPYIQSGGIITLKMNTIDQQIARTNTNIDSLNDRLERKEDELKQDYATMEGALQNMKEVSRSIGNLNNNSQ